MFEPKSILALDQSKLNTGFAFCESGKEPTVGLFRTPHYITDMGEFLVKFDEWITDMLDVMKPDLVIYEAAYVADRTSQETARKLLGLSAFVQYACRKKGIRYKEVKVQTWSKHFTGRGNDRRDVRQKKTMKRCQDMGFFTWTQDQCDAFAILDYMMVKYGLTKTWTDISVLPFNPVG